HAEREQGLTPEKAIYQACIKRLRPILMTTMAAMLGAVPLMLGTGTGSEIREPLGYAIVGGLALSQFFTPHTTPLPFLHLHPPPLCFPDPVRLDPPPAPPAVAKRRERVLSASPSRVKQSSKTTIVPRAQQRNVTRRETCGGS